MKHLQKISIFLLAFLLAVCALPAHSAQAVAHPGGAAVARKIMNEGMVLLKNENNALPLSPQKAIALFGESQAAAYNTAVDTLTPQNGYIAFGAGSAKALGSSKMVAPLDAFREAQRSGEITIFEELSKKYEADPKYIPDEAMYNAAAAFSDTAVVFIRRWVGECIDMKKEDWYLSAEEKQMLTVLTQKFATVIAVLNTPAPMDTSWAVGEIEGIDVDAVLFAGYGGAQGGYGIADILLGKTNPSGKLTDTYAKNLNDYPTTATFFNNNVVAYQEDIFLGYRYFETFDPSYSKVNYEFGFGLSYTDFALTIEDFAVEEETVTIKVNVKNTGNTAGKETVQIYFSAPQKGTGGAKLSKAAKELCAFGKTDLLSPGADQTLTLTFALADMAQYDDTGASGHRSAYILEAGEYSIFAGNSIKDAGTRKAGSIKFDQLQVVQQLTEQCKTNLDKRLTFDGTYESLAQPQEAETYLKAGETLTIEAENYIAADSANASYKPTAETFSGLLYNQKTEAWNAYSGKSLGTLWPAGSYAVYQIEAEKAGVYSISFRVSSNSENNSFDILTSSDGASYTLQDLAVTMPNTYALGGNKSQYFSFMDISGYTIPLNEGTNYIKIAKNASTAPNIDSFTLSGNTLHIEAENFIAADSANASYKPKKESFSGYLYSAAADAWQAYSGQVLAQMWPASSYAVYQINVPKDGIYGLSFRVATDKEYSSNSFSFAVSQDSVTYATQEISVHVPNTNALSGGKSRYHSYLDTEACAVKLKEGVNYIKISTLSNNVPNIDSFTLTLKNSSLRYAAAGYLSADSATEAKPVAESFSNGTLKNEATGSWDSYCGKALAVMYGDDAHAIYEFCAPKAGKYTIRFRIASGRDGADNSFDIALSTDNAAYTEQRLSIPVPNTAALSGKSTWHSYMDTEAYTVTLKEGTNYLKIVRKTANVPNIESFILTLDTDGSANQPPKEPTPTDTVISLADVSAQKATLAQFTAQMTTSELATFFVSYSGAGAGTVGGSDAVGQKYGITRINMYDGPGGLGSLGTSFPCETIVACTWNVDLASAMGLIIGAEGYLNGVDLWLAPGMNLHRNPLAGRNFEYYSEDPYLTAVFGTAITKAAQSMGLGVCIKHFVCNDKEEGKLGSDSRVSERALRELYLYPFEKTVKEANPLAVMSAYNIVNGIPASENYALLTTILREEWGFEGFVTGDWNNNKNAIAEINAGNTVRQPAAYCDIDALISAIQAGEISRKTLETGAQDMLYSILRMRSYYTSVDICGGKHTFHDGRCTLCHQADEARLANLEALLSPLLNDTLIAAPQQPGNSVSPADAGDIGSIVSLITLACAAVAAGSLLFYKRKVCNR